MSNAHRTSLTEQVAPRVPKPLLAEVRRYAADRDVTLSRAILELLWQALRSHGMAVEVEPP